MQQYTSFISEHSAEFPIVFKIKEILRSDFNVICPIFPWLNREGSNISKVIHANERYMLLGLFPRRPKVNKHNYNEILIKINEEIVESAQIAEEYGFPMVAGCPLANNFKELANSPDCIWIKLNSKTDKFIKIDRKKLIADYFDDNLIFDPILLKDYVLKYNNYYSLDMIMDVIRDIKRLSYGNHFFRFVSYKPLYFLLQS